MNKEKLTRIYSIYDKYEGFQNLFLCNTDVSALRGFFLFLSNSPFIENYELYCLGSLDLNNGEIESCKELIIDGLFLADDISSYNEDHNAKIDFDEILGSWETYLYVNKDNNGWC